MQTEERSGKPGTAMDSMFFDVPFAACLVIDPELRIAWINDTGARMLGYQPADLIGRAAGEMSHPDDLERSAATADALGAGPEGVTEFESRWRARDGSYRWLVWQAWRVEGGAIHAMAQEPGQTLKRTEDELRQSNARFRSLTESSPLGIFLVGSGGRVEWSNAYMRQMAGPLSTGQPLSALWHSEDRAAAETSWAEAVGAEAVYRADLRLCTPDEETRWVHVTAAPAPNGNGRPDYIGSLIDITERKRAEQELGQTEALFRGSFAGAPVGMAVEALDGRFIQVNRAMCELTGRTQDELVDATFETITHPDDWESCREGLRRLRSGETSVFTCEKRYLRSDGQVVWADAWLLLIRDEAGRPAHVVTQSQDITETRRAQVALRESEERLHGIVENSASGIYVKDLDGRYLLMNQAGCSMIGVPSDDVLGRTDHDFLPAEAADRFAAEDRLVAERGEPLHLEHTLPGPDGDRNYLTAKFALRDPMGRPYAICGIFTDITARVRGQRERLQLEARLNQSQRLESLGMLAGGVAHDFNNLLAVIGNNAAFAAEELPPGSPVEAELEEIRKAADRAGNLVHQLLVFSRRERPATQAFDPSEVLRDLLSLLGRTLGEDVQLQIDAKGVGPVEADPGQFEQIVVNLAINARDAMPDGGRLEIRLDDVELSPRQIRSHPEMAPGPHVRLTVRDGGCGMAPETVSRAFEPFFTTKPKGEGTGLGLATVWGIAARAGGSVELDSTVGEGTTVTVHLPRAAVADAPRAPRDRDDDVADGSGAVVLVVEDDPSVSRVTRLMLTRGGYEVLAALDGEQALALCEGHPGRIDLLLTDVVMPGMSGTTLAAHARQVRPGLPVLFVSGYAPEMLGSSAPDDRSSELLAKPFDTATLLRKVADVLAAARA